MSHAVPDIVCEYFSLKYLFLLLIFSFTTEIHKIYYYYNIYLLIHIFIYGLLFSMHFLMILKGIKVMMVILKLNLKVMNIKIYLFIFHLMSKFPILKVQTKFVKNLYVCTN